MLHESEFGFGGGWGALEKMVGAVDPEGVVWFGSGGKDRLLQVAWGEGIRGAGKEEFGGVAPGEELVRVDAAFCFDRKPEGDEAGDAGISAAGA